MQTVENRVVKDQKELRPAIQGMVLQNKHNYRERHENDTKIKMDMPLVKINGKDLDFDV